MGTVVRLLLIIAGVLSLILTCHGNVIQRVSPRNGTAAGGTQVVIDTSEALSQVTRVTIGGAVATLISQATSSVTVRTGSGIGTCVGDVVVSTNDETLTLSNGFTIDAVPVLPCSCRKLPIEFTGMWGRLRTISPISSSIKAAILQQLTHILAVDSSQIVNFNNSDESPFVEYKFIPSQIDPLPSSNRASIDMYLQLVDMIRMRSPILLHSNWTSLLDYTYLPRPIPIRACFDDSYMQPCPPTPPPKNGGMDGVYNGLMFGFTIGLVLSSYGIHYYFNMNKRRHKANLAAFMRRDPEAL